MCTTSIDSLQFSSIIGNFGALFIVLATACFAIGVLPVSHEPASPVSFEPTLRPPYTSISGMVECLSIFIFAFSCAQNLPSLEYELREPSPQRLGAMCTTGIAISGLMYAVTAWYAAVAALTFAAALFYHLFFLFRPVLAQESIVPVASQSVGAARLLLGLRLMQTCSVRSLSIVLLSSRQLAPWFTSTSTNLMHRVLSP